MASRSRTTRVTTPPGTALGQSGGVTRARRLARLLDDLIRVPGTNIGIGLDPIIGLIPGVGDMIGGLMSSYILMVAAQEGVPASVLTRMLGNIALDSLVGVVPVLGDLFDFGMKSNRRNVDLLERYLATPTKTKAASRGIVALVLLAAILLVVGLIATGVWVARLLGRLVS
ncbi:MAG TPA: DUF4112 domain-containing protein [Gemmatimonadaceae bacterium]|jgi:hypothetical protein|nr:DUF4112 domain-containing protein [Gemmatimonadaceae bacterium]